MKTNLSKLLPIYPAVWLVIGGVHYLILTSQLHLNIELALMDSMVFTAIFGVLGVGLWFLVKFSDVEKLSLKEIFIRHITTGAVSITLWFGSSWLLLTAITAHNTEYIQMLSNTMIVRIIAGILLYIILITVFYLLINYQNLLERKAREESLQGLLHESELNSLRAQIKPHFLFNALNSVSSLTVTNPPRAQEMVINLSEFMRYSLSFSDNSMSTLRQELNHVRLYLEIEKVRFGERLLVEENMEESLMHWTLPPMILQPLIENAVKHGIYDSTGKSWIKLDAVQEGTRLNLTISNNFDPEAVNKKGTGTGLSNVMKRFRMIYGINHLVQVEKSEDIFTIKLSIPEYGQNQSTDH